MRAALQPRTPGHRVSRQRKQEISMKRLHVHVSVDDLDQSIGFYSTLFATQPSVVKTDYAKWMLEDPRVNFAISARGRKHVGVDHLGIQVEDETELSEVYERLQAAEGPVLQQGAVTCCYHRSEKSPAATATAVRGAPAPTSACCTTEPTSACCKTAAE